LDVLTSAQELEGRAADIVSHETLGLRSQVLGVGKTGLTGDNTNQARGHLARGLGGALSVGRVLANRRF